jgi:hypothetical protein
MLVNFTFMARFGYKNLSQWVYMNLKLAKIEPNESTRTWPNFKIGFQPSQKVNPIGF